VISERAPRNVFLRIFAKPAEYQPLKIKLNEKRNFTYRFYSAFILGRLHGNNNSQGQAAENNP
jgi:hypothetical protein